MSVMLLSYNHVNTLVDAMCQHQINVSSEIARQLIDAGAPGIISRGLSLERRQKIGEILAEQMAYSYWSRYSLDSSELADLKKYLEGYKYTHPQQTALGHGGKAKALSSYMYQACESMSWQDSAAKGLCEALKDALFVAMYTQLTEDSRVSAWAL